MSIQIFEADTYTNIHSSKSIKCEEKTKRNHKSSETNWNSNFHGKLINFVKIVCGVASTFVCIYIVFV